MTNYTLWAQGLTDTLQTDPTAYTFGVQFSVSQSATLTGIWFYSPSGSAGIPETIALYAVSGATLAASQAASWTGPGTGGGWNFASFASPPSLSASTMYKACVFHNSTGDSWYGVIANYWTSGAGSGGITSGPLTGVNNATGDGGQDTFTQSASLAYPATSFNGGNYLVDPQVTAAAPPAVTVAYSMRRFP